MNIFDELQEYYSQEVEGLIIEHAIISCEEGIIAGVGIEARDMAGPMFFSVADLRQMADEAERLTLEMLNRG